MTPRKWWTVVAAIAIVGSAGASANAQTPATEPDYPRGKFSGLVFGDYYYNVDGNPVHAYNAAGADPAPAYIGPPDGTGNPTLIGKDLNGTQIRRVYFQHDADLSAKYSTRFRLEVDSKSLTSDGKLGVAVKAAYLQVKNFMPRTALQFGVVTTPTFELAEEIYGYRSIEKTIADFHGLGSSADAGFIFKGFVDGGHKIGFNAMLGNGLGNKPENNRYKKVYFSVPLKLNDNFRFEPYADYEWGPGGADKATYKLLAGFDGRKLSLGGEVVDRVQQVPESENQEPLGLSVFGRYKLRETLTAFARYDRWQPNTNLADRIDSDLYIGGVDYEFYKDLHVMPNVEAAQYRAQGNAVAPISNETQARITFYYKFAKP